jgi:hypothetical protein
MLSGQLENVHTVLKMTPATCRMARTGLGLGVRDLAQLAFVSTHTITRYEGGAELKARTVQALQDAMEGAGATFLADDGTGPGVRLRPRVDGAAPDAAAGD